MRKQKQIEAMVMSIVIMVVAVLVVLFVIRCVQEKKEEIKRALQGESETAAAEVQPETEAPAQEVQDEILPAADPEETVPEAGEVNGPEDVEPEPETEAAAPVRDTLGCPQEILDELRARLSAHCIEWWEPYALAQMFQESRFGIYVENRNGLDKGLLQYRVTYWSALCTQHGLPAETDIFDWRAQLNIYVQDTARRIGNGLTVNEIISRHMMSDYGPYNETYVNNVMRWVMYKELPFCPNCGAEMREGRENERVDS